MYSVQALNLSVYISVQAIHPVVTLMLLLSEIELSADADLLLLLLLGSRL